MAAASNPALKDIMGANSATIVGANLKGDTAISVAIAGSIVALIVGIAGFAIAALTAGSTSTALVVAITDLETGAFVAIAASAGIAASVGIAALAVGVGFKVGGFYGKHANTIFISDYASHGLYAPPRGYHWVCDKGSKDAILAAVATGAIIAVAADILATPY